MKIKPPEGERQEGQTTELAERPLQESTVPQLRIIQGGINAACQGVIEENGQGPKSGVYEAILPPPPKRNGKGQFSAAGRVNTWGNLDNIPVAKKIKILQKGVSIEAVMGIMIGEERGFVNSIEYGVENVRISVEEAISQLTALGESADKRRVIEILLTLLPKRKISDRFVMDILGMLRGGRKIGDLIRAKATPSAEIRPGIGSNMAQTVDEGAAEEE